MIWRMLALGIGAYAAACWVMAGRPVVGEGKEL
jgi:hypothetical protein